MAPSYCSTGYATKASFSLVCVPTPESNFWQKLDASSFKAVPSSQEYLLDYTDYTKKHIDVNALKAVAGSHDLM